jgi:WD40 repeat protein
MTTLRLGGGEPFYSVAWSPDGSRALSGSQDKTVRVWDVERGSSLATLRGHTHSVWSVAWSPDSSRAISGSWDRTIRIWDVKSRDCLATLEGHAAEILSVACSPDGTRVLSGSKDTTLRIWDLQSGRCLGMLEGHTAEVDSVAWSPDGSRLVSGSADKTLRVWDAQNGRCLATLQGHTNSVFGVAWSPDSSRVLSGSAGGDLRVWDAQSARCLAILAGHTDQVLSVAWSPDGSRALSGSSDHTLRVWDVESGECLGDLDSESPSRVHGVAWSPDSKRALSAWGSGNLLVWDLDQSGTPIIYHDGTGYRLGSWYAIGYDERQTLDAFLRSDHSSIWLVSPLGNGGTLAATDNALVVIPKRREADGTVSLGRRYPVSGITDMQVRGVFVKQLVFTHEAARIQVRLLSHQRAAALVWILARHFPQVAPSLILQSEEALLAGSTGRAGRVRVGCLVSTRKEDPGFQHYYVKAATAASAQYAVNEYPVVIRPHARIAYEQKLPSCARCGQELWVAVTRGHPTSVISTKHGLAVLDSVLVPGPIGAGPSLDMWFAGHKLMDNK